MDLPKVAWSLKVFSFIFNTEADQIGRRFSLSSVFQQFTEICSPPSLSTAVLSQNTQLIRRNATCGDISHTRGGEGGGVLDPPARSLGK